MQTRVIRIDWASKAARRLRLAALACWPAFAACASQPPAANPVASPADNPAAARLTITGLESLGVASASKSAAAKLQVTEKALTINATGFGEPVSVTPWRKAWASGALASLNDKSLLGFGSDTARFFRRREPFGLVQSIFVTRGDARLPWLAVQSNAPSGQKLLGDWSVLHAQGRWMLQQAPGLADTNQAGQGTVAIKFGTPVVVIEKGQRWCLYTMTSLRQPSDLPLIDWVLIQQTRKSTACESG